MADTTTTNYGLVKPELKSVGWGEKINDDLDAIDAQIRLNEVSAGDKVPLTRTINSKALYANIVLTTADVADSADKRYCTDAQKTAIGTIPVKATETDWTDYSATSTIVGWASFTDKQIYTKKIGNTVFVSFRIEGTSNETSTSFTLPYTSSNTVRINGCAVTADAGAFTTTGGRIYFDGNSTTVTLSKDMAGAAWTNSGTKIIVGQLFYDVA
jgi:hypothetical protein